MEKIFSHRHKVILDPKNAPKCAFSAIFGVFLELNQPKRPRFAAPEEFFFPAEEAPYSPGRGEGGVWLVHFYSVQQKAVLDPRGFQALPWTGQQSPCSQSSPSRLASLGTRWPSRCDFDSDSDGESAAALNRSATTFFDS